MLVKVSVALLKVTLGLLLLPRRHVYAVCSGFSVSKGDVYFPAPVTAFDCSWAAEPAPLTFQQSPECKNDGFAAALKANKLLCRSKWVSVFSKVDDALHSMEGETTLKVCHAYVQALFGVSM